MADWPKHLLEKASKVTVEAEGHVWEMTGAEMVACLEAAGWEDHHVRPEPLELVDANDPERGVLAFLNARVKFWDCPMNHPQEPRRERIRWEGDVATCLDCGRTNQDGGED